MQRKMTYNMQRMIKDDVPHAKKTYNMQRMIKDDLPHTKKDDLQHARER